MAEVFDTSQIMRFCNHQISTVTFVLQAGKQATAMVGGAGLITDINKDTQDFQNFWLRLSTRVTHNILELLQFCFQLLVTGTESSPLTNKR